jgi:hypothetical protein
MGIGHDWGRFGKPPQRSLDRGLKGLIRRL